MALSRRGRSPPGLPRRCNPPALGCDNRLARPIRALLKAFEHIRWPLSARAYYALQTIVSRNKNLTKDKPMTSAQCLVQSLVAAGQASDAAEPAETPLHAPAARRRDETPLGLNVFDHLQADAFGFGGIGGVLADEALVDEGDLHRRVGDLADGLDEIGDLGAVPRGGNPPQGDRVVFGINLPTEITLGEADAGDRGGPNPTERVVDEFARSVVGDYQVATGPLNHGCRNRNGCRSRNAVPI